MAGIASILRLRDNAKAVLDGVQGGTWCKECVERNVAEICELNSDKQLYEKGENAMGVSIDTYRPYEPLTIEIKTIKGQPTDRVTLKDTGDFYESFFISADNEGFFIDATDWKRDELVEKYGAEIFGLTDKNKTYLAKEILLPELINKTKETLWR
jgi:hypothetical protein